jgi:vacuolar-type H+-ATPase subunit H
MNIVRERRTRVDRMIEEFREAQSRRLTKAAAVKDGGRVVEFEREVRTQAAAASSTTTPRTSH